MNTNSTQITIRYFRKNAIILSILTLCNLLFFVNRLANTSKTVYLIHLVISAMCFVAFLFLIFNPLLWQGFSLLYILLSAECFFSGQIFLALFIYISAVLIAFVSGFFKENLKKKLIGAICLLVSMLCLLLIHSPLLFFGGLISSTIFCWFICFFVRIFAIQLAGLLPEDFFPDTKKTSDDLDLSNYLFTEKELYCIKKVLNGAPYKEIAYDLAVSESVVKKMMCRIFTAFDVDTRERLVATLATYNLIFPAENK